MATSREVTFSFTTITILLLVTSANVNLVRSAAIGTGPVGPEGQLVDKDTDDNHRVKENHDEHDDIITEVNNDKQSGNSQQPDQSQQKELENQDGTASSSQPVNKGLQVQGDSSQPETRPKEQQPRGDSSRPETKEQQPRGDSGRPETKEQQPRGDSGQPETKEQQPRVDSSQSGSIDEQEQDDGIKQGEAEQHQEVDNKNGNTGQQSKNIDDRDMNGHQADSHRQQNEVGKQNQVDRSSDGGAKLSATTHFMAYFITAAVLCVIGYLAFHNKQKIIAFIVEGRKGQRRRANGAEYKRLQTNVDDSMDLSRRTKDIVY